MTRIVERQIQVKTDSSGDPESFLWKDRWIDILTVVERWKEVGSWWRGEEETCFYLVLSEDLGLYELSISEDIWKLTRVYD